MRAIRQQFFLFKRTRQCFWPMLIFIVLSMGYMPCVLLGIILSQGAFINAFDISRGLQCSLAGQLYGYIIFMFVTYEFLSLAHSHKVSETLSCMVVSKLSQESAQLVVLFLINVFLWTMHFLENLILAVVTGNAAGEYLWYSAKLLALYVIGVNAIAILSGYMISMIPQKVMAYIFMVLLAFLATLRYQQIVPAAERLGTFTELTDFFSLSAKWSVNQGFLFPVELHFWAKTLIVISALLFIVFAVLYVRFQKKRMIIYEAVLILVMVGCFGIWEQKISGCYAGYEDGEDALLYHMRETSEDLEAFRVESYDLSIKVDTYMHIRAVMTLSDSSLDTYYFTLFSGFDIIKVTDLSGTSLAYTFSENVIEIVNAQNNLNGVVIEYEGTGTNQCFAGKQGICLIGNVPYYPMAGINPYDPYAMAGQCALEQVESKFHVMLDYSGRVFSNLSQISEGEFSGSSNHVTLLGGFWQEETVNGIDYIFPKYSTWYNPKRSAYLREAVEKYYYADAKESKTGYTMYGKKIIIAPYEFEAGHYLYGTDAMVIGSVHDIEEYYLDYIETGEWYKQIGTDVDEWLQQIEENETEEQ